MKGTELAELLVSLEKAIEEKAYSHAGEIANQMLYDSPSEEADKALNEIINQTAIICDAEDELRYALEDLKLALAQQADELNFDGL
ncbi:MAG: hypothetical protein RMM17_00505 [Acidobacteriota bacterium]|nr:hypothetical protein [Blastocatellia bacterium]MDW8411147.1 hypothetical protein [Acidobacteriota bacterium]